MNVLFCADRFPFPPRDGMDLPLAKLITHLMSRHCCAFALVVDGCAPEEIARAKHARIAGLSIFQVKARRHSRWRAAAEEIGGLRPSFHARHYDLASLAPGDRSWDVIWAGTTVGNIVGPLLKSVARGSRPKFVLGANDCVYGAYIDWAKQVAHGTIHPRLDMLLRIPRIPLIAFHERKYLSRFDAVHLQNQREAALVRRILPRGSPLRMIVAQNGFKEELLDLPYSGADSRKLVLMSQMRGGREAQVQWFLREVWPQVLGAAGGLELFLVGPADEAIAARFLRAPAVRFCGFAANLRSAFEGMSVSIIPARQQCGVVNRVLDAMAAGVPIIGPDSSLATIPGFVDGRHGFAVRDLAAFASAIVGSVNNPRQLCDVSAAARAFVQTQFSWSQFGDVIEGELLNLVGESHSVPLPAHGSRDV